MWGRLVQDNARPPVMARMRAVVVGNSGPARVGAGTHGIAWNATELLFHWQLLLRSRVTTTFLRTDASSCRVNVVLTPVPIHIMNIVLLSCAALAQQGNETMNQTQCSNHCLYANDDSCDDGGPDSDFSICKYGRDCDDCGPRAPWPPPPPSRPPRAPYPSSPPY